MRATVALGGDQTDMAMRYLADEARMERMTTAELRGNYLLENLFQPGTIQLVLTDMDRVVVGGVVPKEKPLALEPAKELAAAYFTERREIGVINIGGPGTIAVDGKDYAMGKRACLYIGRGSKQIEFRSASAQDPARFYLVSYPAHATHPTQQASEADAETVAIGTPRDANARTIRKYIHKKGIASCQLVMGFTELNEGSVWNTMPPHTHSRRSEVYMYFDLPADAAVFHFMGTGQQTRHLVVRNGEAVFSPAWSIHAGAGTQRYCFVWAMGGENQEYTDMDPIAIKDLR